MSFTVQSKRLLLGRGRQQACTEWTNRSCHGGHGRLLKSNHSIHQQYRSFAGSKTTIPAIPEYLVTKEGNESLTDAMQSSFDDQTPLVVRNVLATTDKNAKALTNFASWDYWENRVPETTDCHVEMGGNYSQSEIADVPFPEYLAYMKYFEERFGRSLESNPEGSDNPPGPSDLLYLAQNDLFPEAVEDIDIPIPVLELGEGKLYSTMIWMGPYGCISPLHFDPLDNLLMQFVGTKRVFVCAPDAPVTTGTDGNQVNTSSVNPEDETKAIPDGVTFQQATLHPGDALFLPKKWYHYLRTVETSVSVNTWFR